MALLELGIARGVDELETEDILLAVSALQVLDANTSSTRRNVDGNEEEGKQLPKAAISEAGDKGKGGKPVRTQGRMVYRIGASARPQSAQTVRLSRNSVRIRQNHHLLRV